MPSELNVTSTSRGLQIQTFSLDLGAASVRGGTSPRSLTSLFVVKTRILWAFDITPLKYFDERAIFPSTDDFIGGLVIHLRPFTFSSEFRKREEDTQLIVASEAKRAEDDAIAWMTHNL